MEQRHEVIEFPGNSPIKVFIHKIGDVGTHWHQSIELLYLARGNVDILLGGEMYQLAEDDLFLIGPNIPHSLRSENATMIAVQIKLDYLTAIPRQLLQNGYFSNLQDASSKAHPDGLQEIKHCVAQLLKINIEGRTHINLLNVSICYQLVYTLFSHYYCENTKKERYSDGQLERLQNLLDYINTHFQEPLPLDKLAEIVALTPAHLSKTFKQFMGVTLSEYIKTIRIHRAARYLTATTLSIEEICAKCGFPNTHSFIDAFRSKYNDLPSHWRKTHKATTKMEADIRNEKSIGYYSSDSSILYSSISDFIEKYAEQPPAAQEEPIAEMTTERLTIRTDRPTVPLLHNERAMIGVSRAEELLWEPVQDMLREAQKTIGFRYVKMHSILDDSMMLYSEYGDSIHFNFLLIDRVFDFLRSIGLKPYVQLSFMPKALAKFPDKTTFFTDVITSPPNDYVKWNRLIKTLVLHLIERYGMEEVLSWPFAVWNEPFTSVKLFGFAREQEYYELFANTRATLKEIDARLLVGGPSHFSAYGKRDDSLFRFLSWAQSNKCLPDFLDVHYYDTDCSKLFLDSDGIKISTQLSASVTSFVKYAKSIHQELEQRGFGAIPIYLTEWNSTTSHRDLLSDTCFKSAYIVKNLLETCDSFAGVGYWLLTDLHKESLLNDKLFHGGLGMFTMNGIKKPAFHAFCLLSMLGDELIEKGDGYFVTKKGNSLVVLLYNYHHFSNAYANEVGINCTYTSRYSVFPDQKSKAVTLEFPNMKGSYIATHSIVNRAHGSAFDAFLKMGAVEPLSEADTAFLKAQSIPTILKQTIDGDLRLNITLEPFEIRCIVIQPKRV